MHLSVSSVLSLTTLTSLAAAQSGGFGGSCSGGGITNGHYYTASCGDGRGGRRGSTMDLNLCVGNSGGRLVSQNNGGYAGSCANCRIQQTAGLYCTCYTSNGTPQRASIDMNTFMGNINGYLWCHGHRGT